MNRSEKALVALLRFAGILLLTAVVPAVMPFAWMKEIHRFLAMGELPEGAIVEYLARSLSAVYAFHGAVVFFVSSDVRRYLPVVKCLGVLSILFGLSMLVLDIAAGMPTLWILGEGPGIVLIWGAIVWLAGRVESPTA